MTSHWGRPGTPLASTQVRAPSAELTLTPPASAPRTGDADLPAGCACTPLQQSVDAGTVKFANPKQSLAEVSSWPTAGTQARILNARCRCKAADQTSESKDRRGSKPIKFAPSLPHQTATPRPPYPSHPHNPSGRTRHSTGAMNTHSSPNAATQHSPASAIQATE